MENLEKNQIENLLLNYQDALNASDSTKAVSLYTHDGVFMPTQAPTAEGPEQLKASYDYVFHTIQLKITFSIKEIEISGNYAFALTHSKGETLIHATGATVPEENREIFVLQKIQEDWKIARYMFNKMS